MGTLAKMIYYYLKQLLQSQVVVAVVVTAVKRIITLLAAEVLAPISIFRNITSILIMSNFNDYTNHLWLTQIVP